MSIHTRIAKTKCGLGTWRITMRSHDTVVYMSTHTYEHARMLAGAMYTLATVYWPLNQEPDGPDYVGPLEFAGRTVAMMTDDEVTNIDTLRYMRVYVRNHLQYGRVWNA